MCQSRQSNNKTTKSTIHHKIKIKKKQTSKQTDNENKFILEIGKKVLC